MNEQIHSCHMHLIASLLILLLLHQPRAVHNYPSFANGDIVTVVEKIHTNNMSDLCNTNANNSGTLANDNEYNEWVTSADDLIIPVQAWKNSTGLAYHKIDLLTSDEELPELYETTVRSNTAKILHIDMSDFLSLIPPNKMRAIVNNYYRHDPDVQHAYMFLQSAEYAQLKHELINAPEMLEFLHFLNNNGLDLLNFLHRLTNLMTTNGITSIEIQNVTATATGIDADDWANDLQLNSVDTMDGTTFLTSITEENSESPESQTTTLLPTEQLNGLHGLVDSLLEILPQDDVLTLFFDKLENNEQFTSLVSSFGTPKFAQILTNVQHSEALRNLIFALHNNGIYITKIMDSLRAYFLLGNL